MFYFIPFLTMHFLTYVLIPESGDDIEGLVARSLAPFDESLTVPFYKEHLHPEEIQVMALKFNTHPSDHDALATLMPKWSRNLLVASTTTGSSSGRTITRTGISTGTRSAGASTARSSGSRPKRNRATRRRSRATSSRPGHWRIATDLKDRLPSAVVAPGGNWLEQSTLIIEGWAKFHTETKDDDVWLREVKAVLEIYPDTPRRRRRLASAERIFALLKTP